MNLTLKHANVQSWTKLLQFFQMASVWPFPAPFFKQFVSQTSPGKSSARRSSIDINSFLAFWPARVSSPSLWTVDCRLVAERRAKEKTKLVRLGCRWNQAIATRQDHDHAVLQRWAPHNTFGHAFHPGPCPYTSQKCTRWPCWFYLCIVNRYVQTHDGNVSM